MNASGRTSTANHFPSFLTCRPCTPSLICLRSIRPPPSVCGDRPSTRSACRHGG
ncbi:hypothetical protein PR202_ga25701 [Eleusine coracana subsp. coracana]|uniref:Uncharacterized protein n=1 Tax=Eleusine coracana subsp. coracana TaxID=191504 RepID=A0AAV5DBQ9_ELECO|nr:hypothetical protein PR202_ga25701 [Eleusine coracana subsp. coracana]